MSKIFISYSRADENHAHHISNDLKSLGYTVWFDNELHGGEDWWEKILENIRHSDILIFILSSDSLQSKPCELEYQYSHALGIPILPILVSKEISVNLLPNELAKIHFVDYLATDKNPTINLINSIKNIGSPTSLPNPLPPSPSIPISNLSNLMEKINTKKILDPKEQNDILFEVKSNLNINEIDCIKILNKFKKRNDLNATISKEIDGILEIKSKNRKVKTGIRKKTILLLFIIAVALIFIIASNIGSYKMNTSEYDKGVPQYDTEMKKYTIDPEKEKAIDDLIEKSVQDTINKI